MHAVFPAGTILSCPSCGEGLYKVTARATTEELVMDDGTRIVPLNRTVPSRDAWTSLSCPFCRAWLWNNGQIHTLQYGWR